MKPGDIVVYEPIGLQYQYMEDLRGSIAVILEMGMSYGGMALARLRWIARRETKTKYGDGCYDIRNLRVIVPAEECDGYDIQAGTNPSA